MTVAIDSSGDGVPISLPSAIGPSDAEVQPGLGVFRLPPGAGQFEAFLNDIAMCALHFAGANRSSGLNGGVVVELAWAMAQVTVTPTDRCFFRRYGVRLLERRKRR